LIDQTTPPDLSTSKLDLLRSNHMTRFSLSTPFYRTCDTVNKLPCLQVSLTWL